MVTSTSSERIVLKLLSGIQTGAEVFLDPGEYTIGSGADDDIQITDVSLSAGHGRLRLGPTKVEIQGRAGRFVTTNGRVIEADADSWTELEPLEVVVAGTTQFAIGPRSANWTSLAEVPQGIRFQPPKEPVETPAPRMALPARIPHLGAIAASIVALIVAGGVTFLALGSQPIAALRAQPATVDQLRAALAAFPFGPAITLREEPDGGIYASGYVETPVERRAITVAAEKLGLPVKLRVYTLQSMRSEIATLIQSSRLPIDFSLAPTGTVTLTGRVLDDKLVAQLAERIGGDVAGVTAVESGVRTAKTLLTEIEKLAKKALIGPYVVLRLEGNHVEITGLLPADKVDTWVGFLQAYSKQFASEIGLRSFVQLQPASGAAPAPAPTLDTPAISLGPTAGTQTGDVTLDIDRLKRGLYEVSDLFVGSRKKAQGPGPVAAAEAAATPQSASPSQPAAGPVSPPTVTAPAAAGAILREIEAIAAPTQGAASSDRLPTFPAPAAASSSSATPSAWADALRPAAPAVSAPAAPRGAAGGCLHRRRQSRSRGRHPDAVGRRCGHGRFRRDRADDAARTSRCRSCRHRSRVGCDTPDAGNDIGLGLGRIEPGNDVRRRGLGVGDLGLGGSGRDHVRVKNDGRPQTATRAAASTGVSDIVGALGGAADRLIARWMQSQDPKAGKDDVVAKTLDAVAVARAGLDRSGNAPVEEQESRLAYLPLLGSEIRADAGPERMCWPGSRLSVKSVPVAAFWLDMLSLSDSLSLKQFSLEQQRFLLEAATNPRRTAACLEQQAEGARTRQAGSFYFAEAARNPEIIRFLVRDLPVADLEIVGVNLVGDRYVQLKDGFKRREGMLTTPRARIAMIGELGIVLREQNGYSVEVFGSSVNWTLSQN
ncbi:FHA domain-containing protein [Methyloraptor flagellatus]|uniref:FHA domain-containing protein n=1 Tax=Methyloraptor flagellatus TaxID=3162530 RepID=A0AAU7X7S5_9HYPH